MTMTGYEQAQIGLGSASLLNEAFGNPLGQGGVNWRGKYYDNQMRDRTKYEPALVAANQAAQIKGKVKGAKEAGLHPLFALGSSGGSSPSFNIPGQSSRGDFKADGLIAALGGMANRRNDMAMQQLMSSALKIAENATSNDSAQAITKPGERDTHHPVHREQSYNEKSPMTKVRIGSQDIWLPMEDVETLADNPGFVLGAAALYHGNKGVDWPKAWREYTGAKPTPVSPVKKYVAKELTDTALRKKYKNPKTNPYWGMGKRGYR